MFFKKKKLYYITFAKSFQTSSYSDGNKKWLKIFIKAWFLLFVIWGFSLYFEVLNIGYFGLTSVFGLLRFWYFYIPVFGFFLNMYYRDYCEDGKWIPGPSYFCYILTNLKDFFIG